MSFDSYFVFFFRDAIKVHYYIRNWLVERTQYVEIGKSKSEKTNVRRSCVQGSVLGPTLWLIYIQSLTDLLDKMNIEYFAYADDLSIVYRIRTDLDRLNFEAILETLQNWADNFDIRWSPLKTQRMVFNGLNLLLLIASFESNYLILGKQKI